MIITKEQRAKLNTSRDIIQWVLNHAKEQRCKAVLGDICRYRTEECMSCFVGCLITEEEYDPSMEGKGVTRLIKYLSTGVLDRPELLCFLREWEYTLGKLQEIHDNCPVEEWESRSKKLLQTTNNQTKHMNEQKSTRKGIVEWFPPSGGISETLPHPSPFELADKVDEVTGPAAQASRKPKAKLPPSMREAWDEVHKALSKHTERQAMAQAEADAAMARVIEAATAVEIARKLCQTLEDCYEV